MRRLLSISIPCLAILVSTSCGGGGDRGADAGADGGGMGDASLDAGAATDAGPAGSEPGSACNCDADCRADDGHEGICVLGVCFTSASADCSAGGSTAECGAGSRCWFLMDFDRPLCWPDCAAHECAGSCDSDGSCAPSDATSCDPVCGTLCGDAPPDYGCSAARPDDGDCPSGQICRGGVCTPFACADTVMEPNETQMAAASLTAPADGLQICAGDHDWFSFTPSSPGALQLVGVRSFYGSGDLDVELRDAGGAKMAEAWLLPDSYHEENGRGPIDYEGYAVHGAAAAETMFLHVFGSRGAVNDYDLALRTIPWVDGPSCPMAGFTARQCTAVSGGSFATSELVMMPVAHPNDPYVGAGFTTVSGFSWTRTEYVPTSAQWGRRDLIMAIRYAMHVVQEAFPDTAPLGIGEIGMPDGTTPAGHPNFTHHYGTSADISYFITPAAQRAWGQLSYRQICNDATSLDDWSCVDTDGRRGQFGECITGCGTGHIVDIPRTARFLAAIAESGRLRVYGVDTAVDDDLDAELARLAGMGVAGASVARARMASAADDPSWVWHFNHIHVSFE